MATRWCATMAIQCIRAPSGCGTSRWRFRQSVLHLPMLYGLAVDDSHNYLGTNLNLSNPGRGWVMVRSLRLLPEAIAAALEAGDFYATTGVKLTELTSGTNKLSLQIDA